MDRRTLLRLAGLAGVAGLSGCGVASRGGVVVDGPGPSAGTGGGQPRTELLPRSAANSPEALVANFLNQPAGDPSNAKAALSRWTSYMTDEFRADPKWDNESRITVVWLRRNRQAEEAPGAQGTAFNVFYDLVPLGVLDKQGLVTQENLGGRREVTFTVSSKSNRSAPDAQIKPDQYYIQNIVGAPPGMLLSTNGLASYFTYRNLYFWSGNMLVPDGRYVPNEWEEPTREKKLVEWLLDGPAPWLAGVVQSLPDGTTMPDIPGKMGPNKLALNFSGSGLADQDLGRLTSQLTWTLLSECQALGGDRSISPIVIKVDSIEKKTGDVHYLADNPTAVKAGAANYQQAYVIEGGRIRRLRGVGDGRDLPVPLLAEDENQNIEWAAFGTDRRTGDATRFALVTRDRQGRSALLVGGRDKNPAPVSDLAGRKMTQPVFVDDDRLLVIAGDHLYEVRLSTRQAAKKFQASAFSVAADGRRIAYIQRGRLYVGTMTNDNGLAFPNAKPVPVILSTIAGVAWTGESWLAVSGTYNELTRVVEISLDGAMVGNQIHGIPVNGWLDGDPQTTEITSLAASLDDPLGKGPNRRILLTANGLARDVTSQFAPVEQADVIGAAPGAKPVNGFFL